MSSRPHAHHPPRLSRAHVSFLLSTLAFRRSRFAHTSRAVGFVFHAPQAEQQKNRPSPRGRQVCRTRTGGGFTVATPSRRASRRPSARRHRVPQSRARRAPRLAVAAGAGTRSRRTPAASSSPFRLPSRQAITGGRLPLTVVARHLPIGRADRAPSPSQASCGTEPVSWHASQGWQVWWKITAAPAPARQHQQDPKRGQCSGARRS
jgi:hypothetical protein